MAVNKGFAVPNHTQTPNLFFDKAMPQITSIAELKVILAVIRQTFGWHKEADKISLSQLERLTGLSRQGVLNGIGPALHHGFIERKPAGNSFCYKLKLVKEVDQSSKLTGQEIRPHEVKELDSQAVKYLDPQNKGSKQKKESESGRYQRKQTVKTPMRLPDALRTFTPELREIAEPFRLKGLDVELFHQSFVGRADRDCLAYKDWKGAFRVSLTNAFKFAQKDGTLRTSDNARVPTIREKLDLERMSQNP